MWWVNRSSENLSRMMPRLELSRSQILCFRRRVGSLDERLPAGAKSLRRAAWAGVAGLHAARRLIVDPCASRAYGLNHLGAPFADPALGPAVQRLRRGREGPRCILARAVARSRPPPRKGARYCCAAPRVPRWPANAVRPSRACHERPAEQPAIRRADGYGPPALGRCASAGRVDRRSSQHGRAECAS